MLLFQSKSLNEKFLKNKGFLFLLIIPFLTACANYEIPIQTKCHPASSDASVSQIELSPILTINEKNQTKSRKSNVYK